MCLVVSAIFKVAGMITRETLFTTDLEKAASSRMLRKMIDFRFALSAAMLYLCQIFLWAVDPEPVEIPGVANAFLVTEQILSGSEPSGIITFAALREMGVSVVVSVDGRRPDVDAAKRYGLRYIHLPIGYDDVPTERQAQLLRAVGLLGKDKKLYLHCHHGKHRGPAAVAILGRDQEAWSAEKAEDWLQTAGTAEDYQGLFRAVREWKPVEEAQHLFTDKLPEAVEAPGLVEVMVALDRHLDDLKTVQKAGWKPLSDSDISPMEVATLLWESYRETARLSETQSRSATYRKLLEEGEQAAKRLRTAVQSGKPSRMDEALKLLRKNCVSCHKQHRN